jgi:hypothetical protein
LAGFQVIIIGRFWVIAEVHSVTKVDNAVVRFLMLSEG